MIWFEGALAQDYVYLYNTTVGANPMSAILLYYHRFDLFKTLLRLIQQFKDFCRTKLHIKLDINRYYIKTCIDIFLLTFACYSGLFIVDVCQP